ncbi:MAG: hypothetical protein WCR66_05535 [Bacteroidota bacterium]
MKIEEQVTLIEGTFSEIDARDILLNIISTKIHFHSMKNFSAQERFGKEDAQSVKRMADLNHDFEKIKEILDQAKATNLNLNIYSTIQISFSEKQK